MRGTQLNKLIEARFTICLLRLAKETLNKRAFYGEPVQLCEAGINKIKALAPLILL